MKLLGALLIILTTSWIGFEWSRRLGMRPKEIRQLKSALQILEAEIIYSQSPLQEAFKNIANQLPHPIDDFFTQLHSDLEKKNANFKAIWEKSVHELKSNSYLGNNEIEILQQFGRTLGRHDFYQQQKHIQLAITHLDRELEEARDEQFKYSKMAKSLGVLAGVFIVLLLV